MQNNSENQIPIPNVVTRRIPPLKNGNSFLIIFNGGLRAIKHGNDSWSIEPISDDGPCAKGTVSTQQLKSLMSQYNIKEIAFHRIDCTDGVYYSNWAPIVPKYHNHMIGPADIWGTISSNLTKERTNTYFILRKKSSLNDVADILNNKDEAELFSLSISLSLRNMDHNIEAITEIYNDQLVNHIASGNLTDEKITSSLSNMLNAHVHSFFVHFAAARDYLAQFIAFRYNIDFKKFDSMARLIDKLKFDDLGKDKILDVLIKSKYIQVKSDTESKLETTGWLKEATDLRNELVHRRPYGSRFSESFGSVIALDRSQGIFKYNRHIEIEGENHDLLEIISYHYRKTCLLFFQCAEQSGLNRDIIKLTDKDILRFEIKPR